MFASIRRLKSLFQQFVQGVRLNTARRTFCASLKQHVVDNERAMHMLELECARHPTDNHRRYLAVRHAGYVEGLRAGIARPGNVAFFTDSPSQFFGALDAANRMYRLNCDRQLNTTGSTAPEHQADVWHAEGRKDGHDKALAAFDSVFASLRAEVAAA
jgi:hypothetical protein